MILKYKMKKLKNSQRWKYVYNLILKTKNSKWGINEFQFNEKSSESKLLLNSSEKMNILLDKIDVGLNNLQSYAHLMRENLHKL